ncbi:restriction endonuclease subunit S [Actinobacillus equuli]|uniref:restriction endonuclease subunit S n=1 Tax=Actinobacillus equuli TaxID=718 RepID=UPI0024413427|nr:restriction endonuclease subunit S [Actinobacillus equuli]WGE42092.1 restriction endonuclease subunit S [Actinobacillus equuli subsp. haemolyticus]
MKKLSKKRSLDRRRENQKSKKATDNLPSTELQDFPFKIPESWVWVRLSSVTELINGDRGKNYPSKDKLHLSGIPFISAINLNNGTVSNEKLLYLSQQQYDLLGSGKLKKNDLIFCLRGSLGKNGIYPFSSGAIASSLVILRLISTELLDLYFFYYYINSPLINNEINKYNNGTAQPNLSAGNLENFYFPLAPLNEQKRIVAKIEELLPYIEQYAEKEEKLTELHQQFPEQLKKSILQTAIQGKLTERNLNDEPASVLIERIKAEKLRLIDEKKLKKPKVESEIILRDNLSYEIINGETRCIADEIPFDIPENWCWVRLNLLGEIISGGTPKTNEDDNWNNGSIPWITPADMKYISGKYISKGNRNITENGLRSSSTRLLSKNSIVYSSRAPIGYIAITETELCTNQGFKSIDLYNKELVDYLYYALIFLTSEIQSRASGTTFKEISGSEFGNTIIPIPPLNEQKRIVEKIETLFSTLQNLSKN